MTNNKKCLANECENPAFKEMDRCALHCEKGDYSQDRRSQLLADFYNLFIRYLSDELFNSEHSVTNKFTKRDFESFAKEGQYNDEIIINILRKESVFLDEIIFPSYKGRDSFDYTKLLRLFKSIHFNCCDFSCTSLKLGGVEVFFQDCTFHNRWSLFDYKVLANIHDVTYQTCVFKKDVSVCTPDNERYVITNNQFDFSCVFKEKLSIENTDISAALFSSRQLSEDYILLIKALKLENSRINGRFLINNLTAEKLYFKDVEFNEKFEFKNSNVAQVMIDNTNFIKVADFFGAAFESFKVEKCIFEQFVGFEKCKFGEESESSKASVLFKYVTFNDYFNFRSASFFVPISLKLINHTKQPNFLGVTISENALKVIDRETFRIIKHSFDTVGNHVEANHFFTHEMEAHRRELRASNGSLKERLLLSFNALISDHGQNYIKAGGWWLGLVALIGFVLANDRKQWIPIYFENLPACWVNTVDFLNLLARGFLPFSPIYKNHENLAAFILISSLLLASITWHVLVAVRRHSKR